MLRSTSASVWTLPSLSAARETMPRSTPSRSSARNSKRMATVLSPSHAIQSPQLSNVAQAAAHRLAQKFQLLVKLGGNCSLMPAKIWKFGAPVPER
jgi:hypothetical protein